MCCCQLLRHGIGLSTASDTELIAHALCQPPSTEKDSSSPDWVARSVYLFIESDSNVLIQIKFLNYIKLVKICVIREC